ncbi:zinc finger protein zpr1 [Terfezia boudieri ATCC MYA-4762]|uniref:Zinc finger protein zpr1 n=1 Tax=Terfezia boudieri ATCC MYA-4762 TaxID=1051890 RepID=A0A3N4M2V6_9PEZI|nr:zinc finger protein zpr1 [Terfezia boudieri ATCC MYA-4762]
MTTENTAVKSPDMFQPIGQAVETIDTVPEGAGPEIESEPQVVDNIDSLCMNCEEQGVTRLFLTRIPFFKEVVLMSFECPHCGYRNSEIQSAGQIQERGCQYVFKVTNKSDLNRQVVKSETCTSSFPELSLEIPAQRGHLTTIEGLLTNVLEDLSSDQPVRQHTDPENYQKLEAFCDRIRNTLAGGEGVFPFHLKLDDPAGNSWVEPQPGDPRGKWVRTDYVRTREQNEALALTDTGDSGVERIPAGRGGEEQGEKDFRHTEVHTFPATCPSCVRPCNTYMKFVDIPHFKEVVIMSTVCDDCGYKSNEVKTGGAVPEKGIRITLQVQDEEDLARDILKSETCALTCPELNLDLTPGTLGGRFTTLEGLLSQVHDDLHSRIFTSPSSTSTHEIDLASDSLDAESRKRWRKFFEGLSEAKEGKRRFTLIMEDPMGASYLQNLYAPDPDPGMTVEEYERTEEQEEELGLRDMKTEGYEVKKDEGDKLLEAFKEGERKVGQEAKEVTTA